MLKIDIHSAPPMVTLYCSGRVVLGVEAETLRCMTHSRTERHVSLDFRGVYGLDAAGLGLLVELHRWAQQHSARLSIANPSGPAHKLIALTRLDRVLHIAGGQAEPEAVRESDEWQTMTA
jgi:anti-anti-sigma factor